jgi:hypothetical protein
MLASPVSEFLLSVRGPGRRTAQSDVGVTNSQNEIARSGPQEVRADGTCVGTNHPMPIIDAGEGVERAGRSAALRPSTGRKGAAGLGLTAIGDDVTFVWWGRNVV